MCHTTNTNTQAHKATATSLSAGLRRTSRSAKPSTTRLISEKLSCATESLPSKGSTKMTANWVTSKVRLG